MAKKAVTVTKKDLIKKISTALNVHEAVVGQVTYHLLDEIRESLVGGKRLEFRDFGVFEVVTRKEKIGRNPKRADVSIVIPERKAVKFTPGKKMKDQVAQLVSQSVTV